MAKQWYVVHTYSGYENKAKTALEERVRALGKQSEFGEILVPAEKVVELVKGKKKTSSRMFFPGYMLVNMDLNDDTDWQDEGEWVLQNMKVDVPMGGSMEFVTELVFDELTMLRMTVTGAPIEDYIGTGVFDIGETEDHIWTSQVPMGY